MAQQMGGLPDPAKINLYGAAQPDVEEYQKSLQDSIDALQQRYENPNWFNVAAGFFKPQLGGFAASLGSASQALGENLEKQRESQLPIAQMRSQLAMSKIAMGQNKGASDAFAAWKATGKPMDEATYSNIVGLAPNSNVAAAAKAAYEGERTGQTLRTSQQQLLVTQQEQERQLLGDMRRNNLITPEEYNARLSALNTRLGERPPVVPIGTTGTAQEPRLGATTTWTGKMPLSVAQIDDLKARADKGDAESADVLRAYMGALTPGGVRGAPSAVAAAPAADTSKFQIQPTFVLPHANPVTDPEKARNSAVIKQAAAVEDEAVSQYVNYKRINDPNTFSAAKQSNEYAIKAINEAPEQADRVTNLLRKAGPAAAMLQHGLGIHIGPYGASINIDVESGLNAGLDADDQNYRDALLNSVATSAYFNLLSRGITPEKAGAEKFKELLLQETGLHQGIKAIAHTLKKNDIQLDYVHDLYSAINSGIPVAQKAGSLTPFHDISLQHPEVKVVNKMYKQLRDDEDASFLRNVTKGKKP